MTRHNTGNPLGSTDPRDLYDNAENLDAGINGTAETWVDRLGQTRKSMAGIEADFQQFLADGSTIEFPTWASANAAAGSGQIPNNRQVAVIGDNGTHVDPVTGETVSNSGRYVMTSGGLQWRSADVISLKADKTELEAVSDGLLNVTTLDNHELQEQGLVITDESANLLIGIYRETIDHKQINEMQVIVDGASAAAEAIKNFEVEQSGAVITDESGNILIGIDVNKVDHPDINNIRRSSERNRSASSRIGIPAKSDVRTLASVVHAIVYGQSLSLGFNAKPAIEADESSVALMFSGGIRPYDNSGDPSVIYSGLIPLKESTTGPSAGGNGYIDGTTLTISSKVAGTASFAVGQYIGMSGAAAGTRITALGSGSGDVGTYQVNISQNVGSASSPRQVLAGPGAITGGGGGQTVSYSCSQMYSQLLSEENNFDFSQSGQKILFSASGQVGTALSGISKGTPPFARLSADISNGRTAANSSGRSYAAGSILMLEGESDYAEGTSAEIFKQRFRQFRSDVQEEAQLVTGVSRSIPLITYQTATHRKYLRNTPDIAIAQLEMSDQDDFIAMAAPTYMLDYHSDGVHLNNRGQAVLGAYFGIAMKRWIVDGIKPKTISVSEAYRVGSDVVLEFDVPSRSHIVLDNSLGSANYGFSLATSSGADVPISSVQILGPYAVLLRTASDSAAISAVEWRYAWSGNANIGLGGLRDSQGEWIVYDPSGLKIPMHNWMPISRGDI